MTLNELRDEVFLITGRPDREAETFSAIRSATLMAHQKDFFYRDLRESGVDLQEEKYVHSWDYRAMIPRWRAFKYFRKSDVSGADGCPIELLSVEMALDAYGAEKQDAAYVAGDNLQINSSTLLRYARIGWYENPDVTQAGYTSWIADAHPFLLIHLAASQVFRSIGRQEEAVSYRQLAQEELSNLIISNVQGVGY